MVRTPGHNALRQWFDDQPHLVKAQEADEMDMSRQSLDHVLSGRRRPTLAQALQIYRHTGIAPYLWLDETND